MVFELKATSSSINQLLFDILKWIWNRGKVSETKDRENVFMTRFSAAQAFKNKLELWNW